jgi:hypothetical protein
MRVGEQAMTKDWKYSKELCERREGARNLFSVPLILEG